MADDTAPKQQGRKPFTRLPPALAQLVDDRFDEDQYDQAVELLEQVRAEGVRPSRSVIQKLFALSLCSLGPGQVASTSRWTLDHQLHNIASRLLMTQSKGTKGDKNGMKAASAASDQPSQAAVLKATSLLLHYSQVPAIRDTSPDQAELQAESERNTASLARHVLSSLPSRRHPLESAQRHATKSPKGSRQSPHRLDDSDHDHSFEDSSIDHWVRTELSNAEDVWDLLCNRRYSSLLEQQADPLGQISEFWMNDAERKKYQKQLQATQSGPQRLEDRLRDLQRRRLNGQPGSDSSDSDVEDSSDEDNLLEGLRIPGGRARRTRKSIGRKHSSSASAVPSKRARTVRSEALQRDEKEDDHADLRLTEGAWRTLSVLLLLWERASPLSSLADTTSTGTVDDEPPLLWQFPHSRVGTRSGRNNSKAAASQDATDDIGRALDIAFSFPGILPAYTPASTSTAAGSNLFDTKKAYALRGDARPISSVPSAELRHRQEIGNQKHERLMAARAETAAHLLASIYELVKLKHIRSVAFDEGLAERVGPLRTNEVQHLMLPLVRQLPSVAAKVLATYLEDATRTHPTKKKVSALPTVALELDQEDTISIDAKMAYAIPHEDAAIALLRKHAKKDQNSDAKAVLDFLSVHRLELDPSADSIVPLIFPDKADSARSERLLVRQQLTRKSSKVEEGVTAEMTKGGLLAYAFVRLLQMQERDRINQIKFLLARSLVHLNVNIAGCESNGNVNLPTISSEPDSTAALHSSPEAISQQLQVDKDHESANKSDSKDRAPNLRCFLQQLTKSLERDFAEFQECLSAIRSHSAKDVSVRRKVVPADRTGSDAFADLSSLETTANRCQKLVDATENLVYATKILSDPVS